MDSIAVPKDDLNRTLMRTAKGSSAFLFTFLNFDAENVTYLLRAHSKKIITLSDEEVTALEAEVSAGRWATDKSRTLHIRLNPNFNEHWCEDFAQRLHAVCKSIAATTS